MLDILPEESPDFNTMFIPVKYRPPPLDTPEAIEKWRAERRKNWPSDKVIKEKEKLKKFGLNR
tara:strand:+ start:186 stop:374 length:189 start_codon:yes stop_codon:yes gene_type:complete